MADQKADANFTSATALNKIQQELRSIQMESPSNPELFRGVTGDTS